MRHFNPDDSVAYIDMLADKILNKETLSSGEVEDIISYGLLKTADEIEGENRRWTRTNRTILDLNGRYFELLWDQGLTEMQENEYPEQIATEVKKIEKIITLTEWEDINETNN